MNLELLGELFGGSSITYIEKLAPRLIAPGLSRGECNAVDSIEGRLHQLEIYCRDLGLKIKPVVILVSERVYKELLTSTEEPLGSEFFEYSLFGKKYEVKVKVEVNIGDDFFYILPMGDDLLGEMLGKRFSMFGIIKYKEISFDENELLYRKAMLDGLVYNLKDQK